MIQFEFIGQVRGGRVEATKDGWADNRSTIVFDPSKVSPDSLLGVLDVSHIEVIFYFHAHAEEPVERGARHPRNRSDWPRVGIFAQHGRMRPNRIGTSICEVVAVNDLTVEVRGLDAIDRTPVLDIKPVWAEYLPRSFVKQPDWSRELMAKYW